MISSGSYEISTFSTSVRAEMKRLDSQIDLFWSKEVELYNRWGLNDGMQIVDLGCGTGHLIEKLTMLCPSAKFTGVELDPVLLDMARARLQNNKSVEAVFSSSIEKFSPQKNSFDMAIMRLVLEHLPQPVNVLKHVREMLKPGGRIIVIDNDFDYHLCSYPEITELKDLYNAYRQSRIKDQGDPCIGRKLPLLLKAANFGKIEQDIVFAHSQLTGDLMFLHSEGAGIPAQLVRSGFLDEKIFDSLIKKWKDMLNEPDHCLYRQLFVGTGIAQYSSGCENIINENNLHKKCVLKEINPNEYRQFIKKTISETLNISGDNFDEKIPLVDAGLDSTGAMEIQNAFKNAFNIEITFSLLLGGASYVTIVDQVKMILNGRSNISGTL